jgi:hypothetical protein
MEMDRLVFGQGKRKVISRRDRWNMGHTARRRRKDMGLH